MLWRAFDKTVRRKPLCVRGGRYGISIDFGLEVVEKKSTCGATFKSKFIDLTMKPRLTIASS